MLNMPRTIEGFDATSLWTKLLEYLLHSPDTIRTSPRGQPTREAISVTLRLRDGYRPVINLPARALNYHFMVAEWMWISTGRNDTSIVHYNKALEQFSDDGLTFFGAYGPRWTNQLPYVVQKLKADPDSRQAVSTIWQQNPPATKDVPCTISTQYIVRNGKLHSLVSMRSSDVWLGVPYDIFNFSMLANIVAGELGLPLGEVRIHLGSSHMYDRNRDVAERVLEAHVDDQRESPEIGQLPGRWPPEAHLWWQLARAGTIPQNVVEPWTQYLAVLADRTVRAPETVPGPIGHLMLEQLIDGRSLR